MNKKLMAFILIGVLSVTMIGLAEKKREKDNVPAVIKSPSSAGEVTFAHQMHFEDFEFECEACHHEKNATELNFPHQDYFDDFWIDCKLCHNENGATALETHACSKCHHDSPTNISDETLSAKVVIHKNCWQCHEVANGQEASNNCKFCHSGTRIKY